MKRAPIIPDPYEWRREEWLRRNTPTPMEVANYAAWKRANKANKWAWHKGKAHYDAERMRQPLVPDRGMRLLPPTGELAKWIRENCKDVKLAIVKHTERDINWNDCCKVVPRPTLKESWHCGRFHDSRRIRESIEPDAEQTALTFADASFTFANSVAAAKAIPAIERIRAGRLLAKDLPKHIASPPIGLTTGSDRYSYSGQQWFKADANGYKQLTIANAGPLGCTESKWNARKGEWETRTYPPSKAAA